MLINSQMIMIGLKKYYDDLYEYYTEPYDILLTDEDELHDIAMTIEINSIPIEDYDAMYYEMVAIINAEKDEIIDAINDYIEDEHLDRYWGDPAFASMSDFLNYKFG